MEALENSVQDQDGLAGEVNESLGEPQDAGSEDSSGEHTNETLSVQKRLKAQKRSHEREIRDLHARIGDLQSKVEQPRSQESAMNPYNASNNGGVDEQIHKAVSYALQHKEMEERKAKEAHQAQHVQKQYQELHKHLDNTSDKYDDFDDVVRGEDASFTPHMRDAALFLPRTGKGSAGEVLYKLGKNPEELNRIARLHPLDQAQEMVKLSQALADSGAQSAQSSTRSLGQIKSNPVTNSRSVTDKTSVSELRDRMKSNWK